MPALAAIKMKDLRPMAEECLEETGMQWDSALAWQPGHTGELGQNTVKGGRKQERDKEESKTHCSSHKKIRVIYIFLQSYLNFIYVEEVASYSGLVGKGMKLICIQNSDPFYCHLHKDGGEGRGGEAGMISGRREQEGWTDADWKESCEFSFVRRITQWTCPVKVFHVWNRYIR